jgi:hypothetical protein
MNTGLIIGIISLSLVSIVAVVVVVISMNKKTTTSTVGPAAGRGGGPTVGPSNTSAPTQAPTSAPTQAPTSAPTQAPTSAPTQVPTSVPRQVQPDNYTTLYEYLPSVNKVDGYQVDKPEGELYAYSLLNTSSYSITKVGLNFNTTATGTGVWLYKLDKNKVASPGGTWTTIYHHNIDIVNKLYIQDILIEPGESFVIDMRQIRDTANLEIKSVEVLLPGSI